VAAGGLELGPGPLGEALGADVGEGVEGGTELAAGLPAADTRMAPRWAGGSTRRSVTGAGFLGQMSGGWLEADLVAEGFQLGDEAAGLCFGPRRRAW